MNPLRLTRENRTRSQLALLLKLSYSTFYRRLKELEVQHNEKIERGLLSPETQQFILIGLGYGLVEFYDPL